VSFCGECGNKFVIESTFCQECGTKFDDAILIENIDENPQILDASKREDKVEEDEVLNFLNSLDIVDEVLVSEETTPQLYSKNKLLNILLTNYKLYLKITAYVYLLGFSVFLLLHLAFLYIFWPVDLQDLNEVGFFPSLIGISIIVFSSYNFIKNHKSNYIKTKKWYTIAMYVTLYLFIVEALMQGFEGSFFGFLIILFIMEFAHYILAGLEIFTNILIFILIPTFNILIMNKPSIFQS